MIKGNNRSKSSLVQRGLGLLAAVADAQGGGFRQKLVKRELPVGIERLSWVRSDLSGKRLRELAVARDWDQISGVAMARHKILLMLDEGRLGGVIFSDECAVKSPRIHRTLYENYLKECICSVYKSGDVKLPVWSCIWRGNKGPLIPMFEKPINRWVYILVLEEVLWMPGKSARTSPAPPLSAR